MYRFVKSKTNEYIKIEGDKNKMMRNNENSVMILFKDFDAVKKFCGKVSKFESDVNIYYDEVNYYDAKSIMAIYAIDFSKPRYIEIMTNSDEEREMFLREMEEFKAME